MLSLRRVHQSALCSLEILEPAETPTAQWIAATQTPRADVAIPGLQYPATEPNARTLRRRRVGEE